MNQYDIVVVGAGPAGCSAARTASQKGARVIVIEEHRVIGLPRHCAGRLQGSTFTEEIVRSVDPRVILAKCRARRFYSPSGGLILEEPILAKSAYMLVRDEFDRELARLAAEAGAEFVLNTRVTGLIREKGVVCGVETTSRLVPKVYGEVVICAQGSSGRASGIARWEDMSHTDEEFAGGVLLELRRVRGLEAGIPEVHLGNLAEIGFARIWTRDNRSCWVTCPSLEAFEKMRQSKYLYADHVRDSVAVQMHGWSFGTRSGDQLPKLVKDGLMLVGDSAGYTSIIHAVVSGRFAAEVAVDAVGKGDVSAGRLAGYQRKCERLGLHKTGLSWKTLNQLRGLSDRQIEARIPVMVEKGELVYSDILPF
ncbi:MAG: NAD(P)/FAD-dependent oxidoreductase [Chloroflexota bacterium]